MSDNILFNKTDYTLELVEDLIVVTFNFKDRYMSRVVMEDIIERLYHGEQVFLALELPAAVERNKKKVD